jgi:hypothetical protein
MRRACLLSAFIVAVAVLLLPLGGASAGSADGKRPANRPRHDYGFLPGYEPPEVVEWRQAMSRRPTYWYGGPRFYRGRWNGGGFGPCWTQTPIGPHWNCG